LFSFKLFLLSL